MRAYLIDPFASTVTQVEHNDDYKEIYRLLSGPNLDGEQVDVDLFDVVRFRDTRDVIYVDDEGLYKPSQAFFLFDGYPNPLAGRGLILGTDDEGDSTDPEKDIEWVRQHVNFVVRLILDPAHLGV